MTDRWSREPRRMRRRVPSPLWGGARGGGAPDLRCSAIPPPCPSPTRGEGTVRRACHLTSHGESVRHRDSQTQASAPWCQTRRLWGLTPLSRDRQISLAKLQHPSFWKATMLRNAKIAAAALIAALPVVASVPVH